VGARVLKPLGVTVTGATVGLGVAAWLGAAVGLGRTVALEAAALGLRAWVDAAGWLAIAAAVVADDPATAEAELATGAGLFAAVGCPLVQPAMRTPTTAQATLARVITALRVGGPNRKSVIRSG
jgi:hypothetical protein